MNLAPVLPLKLDDQNGYAMITDLKKLISFHLKNLLLTSKGEKISDHNYGVGLKRYLFEPMQTGISNKIRNEIENQISRYLSYVNLKDIKVFENEGDYSLSVQIVYSPFNSNLNEIIVVNVDGSVSSPSAGYL